MKFSHLIKLKNRWIIEYFLKFSLETILALSTCNRCSLAKGNSINTSILESNFKLASPRNSNI